MRRCALVLVFSTALMAGSAAAANPAGNAFYLPLEEPIRVESEPTEVVVEDGDHLWSISSDHLQTLAEHTVAPRVLGEYWREVVSHNRNRIRSGDPDLIYSGEIVELPPASSD